MILAIDIGGTKTLVVLCDNNGNIKQQNKFPTPKSYSDFIKELTTNVVAIPTTYKYTIVAVPGKLDRQKGIAIALGSLPWKNKPIRQDIERITGTKVVIENDANMAALYATHSIKPLPHKSLYITISTGIGTGFVVDGVLDPDFLDSEGGNMLLEKGGKLITWEHIASGKSIVEKYGLKASEINDPKIWDEITKDFAIGIVNLSTVFDPDAIIIGGGVGTHFNKYKKFLNQHIKEYLPELIDMPKVLPANNAEEAVILGCAILAKQINDQP